MAASLGLLTVLCLQVFSVWGQDAINEEILSTVIYTLYGDRTPYIIPQDPVLTPLGAQQLYNVGARFRERYVVPTTNTLVDNTSIRNISPYQYSLDDIDILSTDDQFIIASAQAFMQGLYPPLVDSSNYTFIAGLSELSNGSNVVAPLHGYQYPKIYTTSTLDLNSIWISGMQNCPMYTSSVSDYYTSSEYQAIAESSASFYASLEPNLLQGIFTNSSLEYYDAYNIWDYLNYAATHNITVGDYLSSDQLAEARELANEWAFALTGNLSAYGSTPGDRIRAIAGQTLATRILEAFYTNINTEGEYNKMSLFFGSFEPMMSFAALAQLPTAQRPEFYQIPDLASSMVFELFTLTSESDDNYPSASDLYVRFLFQSGSDPSSQLTGYPLFGRDDSQIMMTLDDFVNGIESIMMMSIANWCTVCNSYSVFCPAFEPASPSTPTGTGSSSVSASNHGLSPAVAGVIGAIAGLVFVGLLIAAAMLFGGMRIHRRHSRKSELGGFKGGKKLASDQDLTLPKGTADATVADTGVAPTRGHERVGSWELRDQAKAEEAQMPSMTPPAFIARRPSYEDDDLHVNPFSKAVKPHDQL